MRVCMFCTRHCAATNIQREYRTICNRLPGRLHENVFAVQKICSAQGTSKNGEVRNGKMANSNSLVATLPALSSSHVCSSLLLVPSACSISQREKGVHHRARYPSIQNNVAQGPSSTPYVHRSDSCAQDSSVLMNTSVVLPRLLSPPADHFTGLMMMFVTVFITLCRQATARLGNGKRRHLCDRAH